MGSLVGFFHFLLCLLFLGSLESLVVYKDFWVFVWFGSWILLTFGEKFLWFLRSGFSGWNFLTFWCVSIFLVWFFCNLLLSIFALGSSLTGSCFPYQVLICVW